MSGCRNGIVKECFSPLTVSNNFEELLIEYCIDYKLNVNFSLSSYYVNDV